MNRTLYLLLGAAAGAAATYLYLNGGTGDRLHSRAGIDSIDDAASKASNWASKQRITGTGSNVVGKIKQGFGEATGNDQLANEGVLDQVKGAVRDVAGKAAHAAVDAVQEVSK